VATIGRRPTAHRRRRGAPVRRGRAVVPHWTIAASRRFSRANRTDPNAPWRT